MEAHEIETEDGYLLGVQRIPHGKSNAGEPNKPVVYMMHGLMSCAADWINIGPEKSLAYKLADLGYDVWMGNARGSAESRKHKTLDPDHDRKAFWSFSWNEIGRYDLPATIDYILELTGQEQLQYVGYSQGTTSFFVMASSRPEYNAKIKMATLLAPAAEMEHLQHPLAKLLSPVEKSLSSLSEMIGVRELLGRSEFLQSLSNQLCTNDKPIQELCKIIVFLIAGYDRAQLDGAFIPVITTNSPAGANLKQFLHYLQNLNSGGFRNWDFHDEALNIEAYGTAEPPSYDISKITVPVSVFHGENDWLVSVTVSIQQIKLKTLILLFTENFKFFRMLKV